MNINERKGILEEVPEKQALNQFLLPVDYRTNGHKTETVDRC